MPVRNIKTFPFSIILMFVFSTSAGAQDCADWNTEEFFSKAKKSDVIHCLAIGYDPEVRDSIGMTPLHFAAKHTSNPDVVTALLEAGADISERSENGRTPLHFFASKNSNTEVITALLESGADIASRDNFGGMPLHRAAGLQLQP